MIEGQKTINHIPLWVSHSILGLWQSDHHKITQQKTGAVACPCKPGFETYVESKSFMQLGDYLDKAALVHQWQNQGR